MVSFRPLFGSRSSVENVNDSFGPTAELVKTSESEHENPLDNPQQPLPTVPESESISTSNQRSTAQSQDAQKQQQEGNTLAGLLNGAALMSRQDSQSKPEDHQKDDGVDSGPPSRAVTEPSPPSPDDAAAWSKTANEAESSDLHESSRVRSRFGRALKMVDRKIRSTIGVNAPPTAEDMRSRYSVGTDDHVTSSDNHGAVELLNDATLESLQQLSDNDDDDDDDNDETALSDDEDDDDSRTVGHHDDHHPSQSDTGKMDEQRQELKQAKMDAEERRSGSMDGVKAGDSIRTKAPIHVSAEEKMKAIVEEFGECPSLSNPDEPEKLITDIGGVLIKTVLIKGSIFLTNRRLCFLAYIPKNEPEHPDPISANDPAADNHNQDDSFGTRAPLDPNVKNPILKSGPAVIHRPGKMRPKRKVWLELRKDSINAYAASNKLYKPLFSARLSNLNVILPVDWSQPHVIRLVEGLKYGSIELKTQEAALDWRRELEGAAFHARNTAEKVRISIPLERVVGIDSAAFMQFARVVHVDVLMGPVDDATAAKAMQDHHDRRQRHQHDTTMASNNTFISCPKKPGFKCRITQIALGFTHNRASFTDLLREAIKEPQETHISMGFEEVYRSVPAPLLDFDSGAEVDESPSDLSASAEDQEWSLPEKFCHAFGLPTRPDELKIVKAELVRTLHTHGTLAIGLDYLLFWRRAVGRDLKIKVPLNDIQGVDEYNSMLWHHHGVVVHITAHSDMFFDFFSKENRDMVLSTLKHIVQAKERHKADAEKASLAGSANASSDDSHATKVDEEPQPDNDGSHDVKKSASAALLLNAQNEVPVFDPDMLSYLPKVVNVDPTKARESLRILPMRIYCLTIGSRGDVQPYIALCKALKEHGHTPVIVSHPEYRSWVEGHGIEYRGVGGDPAALMKLSVEHRIFSPAFFRESIGKFRVWLDELLRECWEECQGADLLIESPSTMAGIHVAEGLGIPYFRAFTMPWTKTSAYPQAFSVPSVDMGPSYNSSSYVLFDQIMWVATSGQINRWRKHMVGIGPTDWSKLDADSVPFIYNFSPAVVPMPNDWGDRVKISGYWFLDNPESNWSPPKEMEDFLKKAKRDGKKIAYIGFGSITIDNAEEVSSNIMMAVHNADVRAIVAKGWSGRGGSKSKKKKKEQKKPQLQSKDSHDSQQSNQDSEDTEEEHEPEIEIPDDVFVVDSVPHDWLFPQIDIAMHHGGAGTTGASLRAGLVTLIKPFFGDQFFWANRVHKLGAGARVNSLSISDLTDALKDAAQDRVMVEKAQGIGEKIRTEDGVGTAIEFLYKNIALAKRRTQRKLEREATHSDASSPSGNIFTNPLSRFSSHGRQHSSSSKSEINGGNDGAAKEKKDPHRSATLPPTSPSHGDEEHAIRRSASTIVESPGLESDYEDEPTPNPKPERSSSKLNPSNLLPSMSTLNILPAHMASTLKEVITLQSFTGDTTADGEDASDNKPGRSQTAPGGAISTEDETEEQRMARLKGYKNAKAEDIRRRKLLQERLEREKRETEEKEAKEAKSKDKDDEAIKARSTDSATPQFAVA